MKQEIKLVACKTDVERLALQAYLKKAGYRCYGKEEIDDQNVYTQRGYILHTEEKSLSFMNWGAAIQMHQYQQPYIRFQDFMSSI